MRSPMETIKSEKIYAFDSLYTTNHIEILKIILPCLNPPLQRNLALYIKFLELRYTISFLNAHPYVIKGCGFDKAPLDWNFLKNDLSPYLTPEEAGQFRQIQKSMDMMKQFSSMQKNLEALKDILPEGMDLETLFQSMMGGGDNRQEEEASHKSGQNHTASDKEKQNDSGQSNTNGFPPRQTSDILKAIMANHGSSSSEDIMKNMMSSSQMDMFQKFNERFKNI